MKTSSLLLACVAAGIALFSAPTTLVAAAPAAGQKCDSAALIAKAGPLLKDANLPTCEKASGFIFYPLAGLPSDAQITKLCATDACKSLIEQLVKADLPSCELERQGVTINVKDTVNLLATKCLQQTFVFFGQSKRTQRRIGGEHVGGSKVALAGLVALHVGRHLRHVAAREQQRDEQIRVPGASDHESLADLRAQAPGDEDVHEAEQQTEHAPGTRRHGAGVFRKRGSTSKVAVAIVITVLWNHSAVVRRPPGLAAKVVLRQVRAARAVVRLRERDDRDQKLHDRDREESAQHRLVAVETHARRDLRERDARTERGHEAVRHQVRAAAEQSRPPRSDADAAIVSVRVRTGRSHLDREWHVRAFTVGRLGLDGQVDRSHRVAQSGRK